MKLKLNNYIYSGNQMWSSNKTIHDYGCGIVAAFDSFCYLYKKDTGCDFYNHSAPKLYCEKIEKITKKYFPLVYPFGINGLSLASGINKLFHDHGLNYTAQWVSSEKKLFERINCMLSNDIPVILSIGPNFPKIWGKHGIVFYQKNSMNNLIPVETVLDHYVIVSAIDDEWMAIRSWGLEYYIRISEYKYYVEKYSNYVFSNIVLIAKR